MLSESEARGERALIIFSYPYPGDAERALIIFSYPYQGDAERARSASVASPYYIFLPLSRRCGASAKRERSEPLLYFLTLIKSMRSEREARVERALIIFSYPYQGDAERARSASVASPYYIFLPLSRRCGASAKRDRSELLLNFVTLIQAMRSEREARAERALIIFSYPYPGDAERALIIFSYPYQGDEKRARSASVASPYYIFLPLSRRCGASAKRERSEPLLYFLTLIKAMRSEREARAERALIIFSYPYQGDAERARSASGASPYYIFLPLSRRCGASAKRERSEPLLYFLTLIKAMRSEREAR